MAKVKPGPLVSSVSGSVGPVTYYETFGKTVVRARVRPHQKISSARYWNRQAWKDLMYWWRIMRPIAKPMWNYQAHPRMHGVNLFVQANRPVDKVPLYWTPPIELIWPDMKVVKVDTDPTWTIMFNWIGWNYLPWHVCGFCFAAADGYSEGRYGVPSTAGWWIRECLKKDDSAWYVDVHDHSDEPLYPGGGQLHRFMVDDIPFL